MLTLEALPSTDTHEGLVFRVRTGDGHAIEVVDATRQRERSLRRVFGLSTLLGCPVKCAVCDAGGGYLGRLTLAELHAQLDALVAHTFAGGVPDVPELRVELTRMGEPAFNDDVVPFLASLPGRYGDTRVTALVSTVGPARTETFLAHLSALKENRWAAGGLSLQLSLFTTDEGLRRKMVPIRTLDFTQLADAGRRFFSAGTAREKVWLNVPATRELPVDAQALAQRFAPDCFAVKLSPLSLTEASARAGFTDLTEDPQRTAALVESLEREGFEVLQSDVALKQDPTSCGRFTSSGLSPSQPRRTLGRG
jgi:23S rRNA (adenine2503-C2)-methyltransferase